MELIMERKMTVTPAVQTWSGTQKLSELDQIGTMHHISVVYLYKSPEKPFDEITEILIDSLSRTLVHFFPLAGRLRSKGGGRYELLCNAKGVTFIMAEISATLACFGDFTLSEDTEKFLIPKIKNQQGTLEDTPLCFVQITRFQCGGLSLSFSSSHAVMDGTSAGYFMSEWARLARGEPLMQPPFLDRTFPQAQDYHRRLPNLDHSKNFAVLEALLKQPSAEELAKMRTTTASLRLAGYQVQNLRKMANNGMNLETYRPHTRYESITAHIWKCATKARKLVDEQPTCCLVTIDARQRVDPPLPPGYFGNAALDVTAKCTAGDLITNPLSFGASKIRDAIKKVTSDYILTAVDFMKSQPDLTKYQDLYTSSVNGGGKFNGIPNVDVVNMVHLSFHGIDFGWGKEIHFGPGYHRIDGDSLVIGSSEGDGSLVILICLIEDHIDAFKKHFYDDILDV